MSLDNNKSENKYCKCIHKNVNYNKVNITLYDNEKITLVNCELCQEGTKQLNLNNAVICLCGSMFCIDHIKQHSKDNVDQHNVVAYFGRDHNDRFHCLKCENNVQIVDKDIVDINDLIDAYEMFYNTSLPRQLDQSNRVILDQVNVDGIVKYIQSGQCKNIVVLTGAGVSVASGIPDYRSPKTGLYNNLQQFKLPYPEAICDIDYIKIHPELFYTLAKGIFPGQFKPTPVHYFIKLLSDKGLLLRDYTQNIDTLERIAGVPESKLVEAHGSFNGAYCTVCQHRYSDISIIKQHIDSSTIPYCTVGECIGKSSLLLPNIVFYGDSLPPIFNRCLLQDFGVNNNTTPKCDLLIVIGTSLKVNPIASMINFAQHVPRLLINNEAVGCPSTHPSDYTVVSNGFNFNNQQQYNDVHISDDCQKAVKDLIEKLNWTNEFNNLINKSI